MGGVNWRAPVGCLPEDRLPVMPRARLGSQGNRGRGQAQAALLRKP